MQVRFIAGFGPIVPDDPGAAAATLALYRGVLGLPLASGDGQYFHTEAVVGAKAFALWPLAHAARSCFGQDAWPADRPVPQAWLEFDVDDLAAATAELRERGYTLLVAERTEPWGQQVSRLQGPDGLLVGVTVTPWMRE